MRLSAWIDEFLVAIRVEQEATPRTVHTYRWCLRDFEAFVGKRVGGTVLVGHFTEETCRAYQYDLAARELQPNSIRIRLATLSSLGRWLVRRERLPRNPIELLTRPRRKVRLPRVPRWEVVERLLSESKRLRDRALIALMSFGGLRRSEIVALDIGDVAADFGLRRVRGKGGHEAAVLLPEVARSILAEYVAGERSEAKVGDPLFVTRFRTKSGEMVQRRMVDHRVWKIVNAIGRRAGVPELHPHAFRHSCGAELLRRSGGNLRAVQEHLRHADIQTTTIYTRLTQYELQKVVATFDEGRSGEGGSRPAPHGTRIQREKAQQN